MKKQHLFAALLTLLVVVGHSRQSMAQNSPAPSLPQIINSASQYVLAGSQHYDWSIGEMVLVQTFSLGNTRFTQGFLQPLPEIITTPTNPQNPENCDLPVQVNNVLTPNGDGKNERLQFSCLEHFPNNRITIYDRAGRIIFQTRGYQNNWGGEQNGRPLNEDTYYYVLEAGPNIVRIKGFITIIRDQF